MSYSLVNTAQPIYNGRRTFSASSLSRLDCLPFFFTIQDGRRKTERDRIMSCQTNDGYQDGPLTSWPAPPSSIDYRFIYQYIYRSIDCETVFIVRPDQDDDIILLSFRWTAKQSIPRLYFHRLMTGPSSHRFDLRPTRIQQQQQTEPAIFQSCQASNQSINNF